MHCLTLSRKVLEGLNDFSKACEAFVLAFFSAELASQFYQGGFSR